MIFESLSLSSAIFLSEITIIGIALYAVFAYLVSHSKNIDTRRRWRYSILWGASSGVFISIIFGVVFMWKFFVDISQSGFMALLKQPNSISDVITGIILFLTNTVLISIPFIFIFTIGTYVKEMQLSDLNVTHLLYPIKKHPSDQSPDNIFTKARKLIASFVDG